MPQSFARSDNLHTDSSYSTATAGKLVVRTRVKRPEDDSVVVHGSWVVVRRFLKRRMFSAFDPNNFDILCETAKFQLPDRQWQVAGIQKDINRF